MMYVAGGSIATRPLPMLKRSIDAMRKEWESDRNAKSDELAQTARTRLSRLDLLRTLRRWAAGAAP